MKKIALLFSLLISTTPAAAGVSCSLPFNLQNGVIADATQVMANYNALVTCLSNAAAAGVNSDITALTALNTPITPTGGGSTLYIGGTSTGSANAQVVSSVVPSGFSLTNGLQVLFTAGFTNTGATTLNVNGTGATAVVTQTPNGGQALVGGEIQGTQLTLAVYSTVDSKFHLKAIDTQLGGAGPVTTIASASTADLSLAFNHNASITGTTTINSFGSNANVNFPLYRISTTGALTFTYNASSMILPGAANLTTAANDSGWALYLGSGNWQIIDWARANGTSAVPNTPNCGFNSLVIKNNSGTPNTNIDVTASSATMVNGSASVQRTSVSFTINLTTGTVTSAANGMDGEARPTSAWVYLYMIDNGTAAAGLGSTSSTSPTLPAGYTSSCRMGAMLTDGSTNLMRSLQRGNDAQYTVASTTNTANLPIAASGAAGNVSTPVWAAIATGGFVPSTATHIRTTLAQTLGTSIAMAAPNNQYGNNSSSTNPPPCVIITTSAQEYQQCNFLLESTNIFWASNGSGGLVAIQGWKDAINAN